MNKQSENFIQLISSYVNNKDVNINNIDNIEWDDIIEYTKINNLGGIIYLVLSQNGISMDKDILDKFKAMFFYSVKYSALQEYALNNIILLFNENKIPHILFKGSVLKNYYPNNELRTMGDIDIVIKKEQLNEVHNLLEKNGYKFDVFGSKQSIRNYEYNGVLFEIHTEIISENFISNVDLAAYFRENFRHSVLKDKYTYEFNPEHHFIYLVAHLAKHFNYSGCGVRMLIDLAMFINYFTELNWGYIAEQLKLLKLFEFAYNMLALCNRWFDTSVHIKGKHVSEDLLERVADYIIQGGVFGCNNKNMDSVVIFNGRNSVGGKILNIVGLIFPSYDCLLGRYVWCGKIPKVLLPIAWIKYWLFRLKSNKNDFKRICNALKSDDDAIKHNKLIHDIGLK